MTSIPSTIEAPVLADEDISAFFELEDLWAVIVWNDDVTTFQTVIEAFVEIFGHTVERADQLAWTIHRTGKAVAAVRPKDEAEAAVHAICTNARSRPRSLGPEHTDEPRRRSARISRDRFPTPAAPSAVPSPPATRRPRWRSGPRCGPCRPSPGRSARMIPSSWPPMRSIAAQERVLRTSVCKATRCTSHVSNAWVIIRSFASVLTAVRWAEPASQVKPMSTTSGTPWRWWRAPGGHCQ